MAEHLLWRTAWLFLSLVVVWLDALVTDRNASFNKTSACDDPYGVPLGNQSDVRSLVSCARLCLDVAGCESVTYNSGLELCKFNDEVWLSPTSTTGCSEIVQYAGKQASTLPGCLSGNSCTVPKDNVRLCEGGGTGVCDPAQGRIEVLHDGTWGTVCDDFYTTQYTSYTWGYGNGDTICRSLGFTSGVALTNAVYGQGVEPIWIDNLNCTGTEASIFDCDFAGWGVENCGHTEDASVQCTL